MTSSLRPQLLQGRKVLVIEDDFMLCQMLITMLESVGVIVLGPVGTVTLALEYIAGQPMAIDIALVDVNLHGQLSYKVADLLIENGTPFVFATGYDAQDIESSYRQHRRVQKPYQQALLLEALATSL